MSKFITLTNDLKTECINEFSKALSMVSTLDDGKFTFTKLFQKNNEKATIVYTSKAWIKLTEIMKTFEKEVGWHGLVKRNPENDKEFIIYDIIVYPQTVTSVTVNTDQKAYEQWLFDDDKDDVFNDIRMHGHSHVKMGVTPSGTDIAHQSGILSTLNNNTFYVFQIWNKSLTSWSKIYDLKNNIMYEDTDIQIKICDELCDYTKFIAESKNMVKESTPSYDNTYYGPYYSGYNVNNYKKPNISEHKQPESSAKKDDNVNKKNFKSIKELREYCKERTQKVWGK